MSEFFDLPTLIIIGIAIFVLMRLRSVLGTRTGFEKTRQEREAEKRNQRKAPGPKKSSDDVVVPLHPDMDENSELEEAARNARKFDAEMERWVPDDPDLRQALLDISEADPNFTPKSFLDGGGAAYEMIVTAFAAGDKPTLKSLLDKEVFEGFEAAIDAREEKGHHIDFTFVGLPNITYVQADLDKKIATITLRFDAEVVSATKDKDGNLIEGDEEQVVNLADEWTFSRNTRSRDPNWKLVATDQIS